MIRVLCLGVLGVALTAGPALAGKADSAPVAVVPFAGLHGDEPQAAIQKALGARAALVPEPQLPELQPYVIVRGTVEKRDGKLTIAVKITRADGSEIGQLAVLPAGGRHATPEQLKQLGADVDKLVTQALAAPAPTPPPPAEPPPPQPAPQATDVERAPLADQPAPHHHPPGQNPLEPVPPPKPRPPRPEWAIYVDAQVGTLITSRSFSFSPTTYPIFHGGTAGGLHGELGVYPLAPLHGTAKGILAGLGGWFAVDAPFWPTTTFSTRPGEYDTSELRVEGGARWRFLLRRAPRVELAVFGGAGRHNFIIAKATDPSGARVDAGPPDVVYIYGVVGLAARAYLWHARLAPWLSVAYEYIPDAGRIEDLDEYGLSSTHALMLRGGLDYFAWRRLKVGISAYWERISLSFDNSVATQKHADSALDQYFGGILTIGYEY